MFQNCTSLTTAPAELPAMTMTSVCYAGMFAGCTSLTNAYVKAAFATSSFECSDMFAGCSNLSTCTLYTDGDWSSYTAISNWQKAAYPTE